MSCAFQIKAHNGCGTMQFMTYSIVFICMETKAVDPELGTDLSIYTLIAALSRFQSTRGVFELYI